MGDQEKEKGQSPHNGAASASEAVADDRFGGVLTAVHAALDRLSYGAIQLTVHDGRVVQLDVTEKRRFSN